MTRQSRHTQAEVPEYLTMQQVADWLNISVSTLRWWRQTGEGPPSFRLGRSVRFDRADIEAWIKSQRAAAER